MSRGTVFLPTPSLSPRPTTCYLLMTSNFGSKSRNRNKQTPRRECASSMSPLEKMFPPIPTTPCFLDINPNLTDPIPNAMLIPYTYTHTHRRKIRLCSIRTHFPAYATLFFLLTFHAHSFFIFPVDPALYPSTYTHPIALIGHPKI